MRTVARRPHEEHRPRPSFTRVNEGAGRCLLPLAAARSRHGNDPHSAAAVSLILVGTLVITFVAIVALTIAIMM